MPLTLYVERDRWRVHQSSIVKANPGIVPVIKGNGYGFTTPRLSYEAAKLRVGAIAVGTAGEVLDVRGPFSGDVHVLTPYRLDEDEGLGLPDRVIRTVSSVDGARALAGRRIVVDCRTSLRRHGVTENDLLKLGPALDDVRLEGYGVHLPLDRPGSCDPVGEVGTWVERLRAFKLPVTTMFVSHLRAFEVGRLSQRYPDITFRPRIGTRLWLGDRRAFSARGTVLDVVRLSRGERYGYRQWRALGRGHLVVVSGGTSHGIGLEAPKAVRGVVPRVKGLAIAGLASANIALSPFSWAGKQRWFGEPPHMQVSLLFLPRDVTPPAVGDELEVDVRMTTTHFDRVIDR
ncbi:MAG: alanine racemase [Carbonactinosporaceae bacterium]